MTADWLTTRSTYDLVVACARPVFNYGAAFMHRGGEPSAWELDGFKVFDDGGGSWRLTGRGITADFNILRNADLIGCTREDLFPFFEPSPV